MSQNNRVASLIGACLLLVLTASVHAKPKSPQDGQSDVQQAVINLRQSITNIVTQTAQGVAFADLQDEIAAISTGATELRKALQESFADALESYDEASAMKILLTGTLKTAVKQNPDVAAMILGLDPASGSGSKLALAIDMAGLLEKELEGVHVTSIKTDASEENDVAATLLTLSDAVMNTVEWMNEAVDNFAESLGSEDNEQNDNQGMKSRQKRWAVRGKRSQQEQRRTYKPRRTGWGLGGHGIQYTSPSGRWSASGGLTSNGGARVGFKFRF